MEIPGATATDVDGSVVVFETEWQEGDVYEVLSSARKECEEGFYDRENSCAGPHHVCKEEEGHDGEHECFCGYTWGKEMVEKAPDFTYEEFGQFYRAGFFE